LFKSFITWLDGYMSGEEPSSLIKSAIGLLSFAVLLGAITGNLAIKAGALVVVLLFIIYAFLALLADRRRLSRHNEKNRRLVDKYCELLKTRLDPSWSITKWDQLVKIDNNGNTIQTITLHAISECDNLDFYRLSVGATWQQPEKYRKRVKLKVRSVDIAGSEGPKCDVTTSWTADHKMFAIVHLPVSVERGGEFRIVMSWEWPAKCRPLMKDGQGEEFCINMTRVTQKLRYRVQISEKFDVYFAPVGFKASEAGYSLKRNRSPAGHTEVTMTATSVPSARKVGMRLELK
jgi:hypothetical protein